MNEPNGELNNDPSKVEDETLELKDASLFEPTKDEYDPSEVEGETLELADANVFEPPEDEYNPNKDREMVRGWLAQALVLLLTLVVLISFISVWAGADFEEVKGILELTLTPLVGLAGAVTGFYFGSKEG